MITQRGSWSVFFLHPKIERARHARTLNIKPVSLISLNAAIANFSIPIRNGSKSAQMAYINYMRAFLRPAKCGTAHVSERCKKFLRAPDNVCLLLFFSTFFRVLSPLKQRVLKRSLRKKLM